MDAIFSILTFLRHWRNLSVGTEPTFFLAIITATLCVLHRLFGRHRARRVEIREVPRTQEVPKDTKEPEPKDEELEMYKEPEVSEIPVKKVRQPSNSNVQMPRDNSRYNEFLTLSPSCLIRNKMKSRLPEWRYNRCYQCCRPMQELESSMHLRNSSHDYIPLEPTANNHNFPPITNADNFQIGNSQIDLDYLKININDENNRSPSTHSDSISNDIPSIRPSTRFSELLAQLPRTAINIEESSGDQPSQRNVQNDELLDIAPYEDNNNDHVGSETVLKKRSLESSSDVTKDKAQKQSSCTPSSNTQIGANTCSVNSTTSTTTKNKKEKESESCDSCTRCQNIIQESSSIQIRGRDRDHYNLENRINEQPAPGLSHQSQASCSHTLYERDSPIYSSSRAHSTSTLTNLPTAGQSGAIRRNKLITSSPSALIRSRKRSRLQGSQLLPPLEETEDSKHPNDRSSCSETIAETPKGQNGNLDMLYLREKPVKVSPSKCLSVEQQSGSSKYNYSMPSTSSGVMNNRREETLISCRNSGQAVRESRPSNENNNSKKEEDLMNLKYCDHEALTSKRSSHHCKLSNQSKEQNTSCDLTKIDTNTEFSLLEHSASTSSSFTLSKKNRSDTNELTTSTATSLIKPEKQKKLQAGKFNYHRPPSKEEKPTSKRICNQPLEPNITNQNTKPTKDSNQRRLSNCKMNAGDSSVKQARDKSEKKRSHQ